MLKEAMLKESKKSIAPCEGIRNLESSKREALESGIQSVESRSHCMESRIHSGGTLEVGIRNPRSRSGIP